MAEVESTHMNYAGPGTKALGIIGTVLGSIGTLGTLGNGAGILNTVNANNPACFENQTACMHDVQMQATIAEKDSKIARIESERYADSVGLKLYEYLDGRLRGIETTQSDKWTNQAVVNSNLRSGLDVLASQQRDTAQTLASITRVGIPQSNIFPCNPCNTCAQSVV